MSFHRFGAAGLALAAAAAVPGSAEAAGYAIRQHSAAAVGNAMAGAAAGLDDITYAYGNPAAFAHPRSPESAAVLELIIPNAEPRDFSGLTAVGTPVTGGNGGSDIGPDALVPAFYGVLPLTSELNLGLAVNAPWGLETDYDSGWAGRYYGTNTSLLTLDINPVLAWRASPRLEIAGGPLIQYADGELTEAIDFGTLGLLFMVPGAIPGAMDGSAEVTAEDWGYGFNLGFLYRATDRLRFGAAWRSHIHHEMEGDVRFTLDSAGVGAAISGVTGAFVDGSASAKLTTPETATFGLHYEIAPGWSVMAGAEWTRWSRLDDLTIRFSGTTPDSVTFHDWNDSWFVALGATWRPNDRWTLRAGVAYDESPVPEATRGPRIPDADRQWLALGLGWRPFANVALDAAYVHFFMDEAPIALDPSLPGNALRGSLTGEVDSYVDILSLQVKVTF